MNSRTDFEVDGTRLESASTVDRTQAVPVTTRQTFRYDDLGNVQRVYRQVTARGDVTIAPAPVAKTALSPAGCEADDLVADSKTVRYCYDEFNRQIFSSGAGISDPAVVTYDGLDRRDRQSVKAEVQQIQGVVNRAGRPLDVAGSAAKGERRGVGTGLPIGKGPGTRSDYLIGPSSRGYFKGFEHELPGLDAPGPINGTHNPFIGPAVRFEPGASPRRVPGQG